MTAVTIESARPFRCRAHAGRAVAEALAELRGASRLVVLGLPRGGVVTAQAVAEALGTPCDVIVARKLGVPGVEEVAFGAIAEGSGDIVYDAVRSYLGIPEWMIARVVERERAELARRVQLFRGAHPTPSLGGHHVVLVDDGMATGATMRAAVHAMRTQRPASITVAVPIASRESCDELTPLVDRVVALCIPENFTTVSDAYDDFSQVSDDDVCRALGRPMPVRPATPIPSSERAGSRLVKIPVAPDGGVIAGDLEPPDVSAAPHGLVIFAHGGGSSRHSHRNAFLAAWLRCIGWSTLRMDLLQADEQAQDAKDGARRFDIALLAHRLTIAVDWAVAAAVAGSEHIVLFGASTGAAAALHTAASRPEAVHGVMSRGGRVDLAASVFGAVRAPVLMVVGTRDPDTLRGSRMAIRALRGDPTLKLVRGAGHTFDEDGALGAVGRHVDAWLRSQLARKTRQPMLERFRQRCAAMMRSGLNAS